MGKKTTPTTSICIQKRTLCRAPGSQISRNHSQLLHAKRKMPAIFLDMHRAFDTVWQQQMNIPKHLIAITYSFLKDRTFQVKILDSTSTPRPIRAGVPQGAVLSPALYNLLTADLKHNNQFIHIFQYAKDIASYPIQEILTSPTKNYSKPLITQSDVQPITNSRSIRRNGK